MRNPNMEFASVSSRAMYWNTKRGNRSKNNYHFHERVPGVILAEGGYLMILLLSAAETLISASFYLLSSCFCPQEIIENQRNWLKSSAFCIVWSLTDAVLNPFLILAADESSARTIALSGNLTTMPFCAAR
jgi:hypothetical protein